MNRQTFTVTITDVNDGLRPFMVTDVEHAFRAAFPYTFNSRNPFRTLDVIEVEQTPAPQTPFALY